MINVTRAVQEKMSVDFRSSLADAQILWHIILHRQIPRLPLTKNF